MEENPRPLCGPYKARDSLYVRHNMPHNAVLGPGRPSDGKADCLEGCPTGGTCILDARVAHELHICKAADCDCHGRQRYEMLRRAT